MYLDNQHRTTVQSDNDNENGIENITVYVSSFLSIPWQFPPPARSWYGSGRWWWSARNRTGRTSWRTLGNFPPWKEGKKLIQFIFLVSFLSVIDNRFDINPLESDFLRVWDPAASRILYSPPVAKPTNLLRTYLLIQKLNLADWNIFHFIYLYFSFTQYDSCRELTEVHDELPDSYDDLFGALIKDLHDILNCLAAMKRWLAHTTSFPEKWYLELSGSHE